MQRTLRRALGAACVLCLLVTGCGDDDTTAADGGGDPGGEEASGDLTEFCDVMEELNSQEAPPTPEAMEQIKDLRPDEIGEEVDYVADAFIAADGDVGAVFSDPEIEGKFDAVDAYLADSCPGMEDLADGDGEGEGEVDPEFAEYCAASEALDGPPTAEQIGELVALAPADIADPASVVGAAVEASGGDLEAVFADPEVGAAIGEIEAWEAENCGGADDGEDGDLEAAEGAEVVPVVGVDFGYEEVPAQIAAGPVAFEFTNEGEAIHEAVLFALDGQTVDELVAEAEETFASGDDEADIGELGFAFAPPGGEPRYVNTELEPGEYVFICFIPGPEGKPHHELGMQQTFTVG